MSDKITNEEKKKLSQVVDLVNIDKRNLEIAMDSMGAFNLNRLKELRDNPATNSADFLQFLNLLDEKNASFNITDKYKKLEELEYLSKEPYFARIDLADESKGRKDNYYIGKFGFNIDKTPVVIDWRAKIASVYYKYRYPQKNVSYDTPLGPETCDLKLKRTFEIDNGELIKYYNNDIKLDENELISDKIDKRTGGVLEDIVETIQESQHAIIEADPRRVCIVQGTVGSGKSTVAIHKLSYIFFNYPEIIRAKRSILIAKNQILVGYLSTLFPKLGIFDINFGTVRDILYNILFAEKISTKFNLDSEKDLQSFGVAEIKKLEKKIEDAHKHYEEELIKVFSSEETQSFGGYVYDYSQPIKDNFTEAIQDLEEEKGFQEEFVKEHPTHPRSRVFIENIKIIRKIIKKLTDLRLSIRSEYLSNFTKDFNLSESGHFSYRDALIYIVLYSELIGFTKFEKFDYCVVDEGQDFSLLEYLALNKLVSNGRFCILGDLNQSYVTDGLTEWEEIFGVVEGAKDAQKFVLDTNYRSTFPIINFARSIMEPYTTQYLPVPIQRKGPEPEIEEHSTNNDLIKKFESDLKQDIKNLDKSIGIICMNNEILEEVTKITGNLKINKDRLIYLRESDRITYLPRAVYVTHFDNCKGLEFGKVYVLGLNLGKIKSINDAKKAFVAVTRAMNELKVMYAKS